MSAIKSRTVGIGMGLLFLLTGPGASGAEFDLQAHRGGRGQWPENTIIAMRKALEVPGVSTLEMDVHISRDGKVVVTHDPVPNENVLTLADGSPAPRTALYSMDFSEIEKMRLGLKTPPKFPGQEPIPSTIPLLADLIRSVRQDIRDKKPGKTITYSIEIKSDAKTDRLYHPGCEVYVETVMKVIREAGIEDSVVIQSFDVRPLKYLRKTYPKIRVSFLTEEPVEFKDSVALLGFKPDILSPDFKTVNSRLIAEAHAAGVRVIPWTVNEPEDFKKLITLGVDGLITDYPSRFQERAAELLKK